MNLFSWLDHWRFLDIRLWNFGVRSVLRAYGAAFLWNVILRHPVKTFRGIRHYRQFIQRGHYQKELYSNIGSPNWAGGRKSIVGVGFCLKPLDPPCRSGRFNHDCYYFEKNLSCDQAPPGCAECKIRQYGLQAMQKGACFYIMTSAKDILHDLFLPALRHRKYRRGVFALCRFSFDPFVLPLMMAEMEFALVPFASGDCRDYGTWLKADVGIKEDQTAIANQHQTTLQRLLSPADEENHPAHFYHKYGNVFEPGDE